MKAGTFETQGALSVLAVHMCTPYADDTMKNALYMDVQRSVNQIPRCDFLIIYEHWNALYLTKQRRFSVEDNWENVDPIINQIALE